MSQNNEYYMVITMTLLFMAIGAALIYWGWYFYDDIHRLRQQGIRTEGVILRYERRKPVTITRLSEVMIVPIVQFNTQSGESVTTEGRVDNVSVLQNICESGEKIEVIYDPDNPQHAALNTFSELWFVPLLLWIIGAGFIFVPPFTIWRHFANKSAN